MSTLSPFAAVPYPRSAVIRGIRWLSEPIRYPHSHGDTWSCTWAKDGTMYCSGDDTSGINKSNNSNLAFFRIDGMPPEHQLSLVNPMSEYGRAGEHDPVDSWKACSTLSVDGVLYMTVSQHPVAPEYGDLIQRTYDASIIKSEDGGKTWSPKRRLPTFLSPRFSTPFFIQYGQDYAGAMDDYVYAVGGTSWNNGNYLTLGRVPRKLLARLDGQDWEFFAGLDPLCAPAWKPYRLHEYREEKAVFKWRNFTSMTGVHFVPALERFLMPQWAYTDLDGSDPWRQTFLHLYEAPKPWGPWSLVHIEEDFGHSWYNPCLPAKWFEDGGRRMWMVAGGDFAGRRSADCQDYGFYVRKIELLT